MNQPFSMTGTLFFPCTPYIDCILAGMTGVFGFLQVYFAKYQMAKGILAAMKGNSEYVDIYKMKGMGNNCTYKERIKLFYTKRDAPKAHPFSHDIQLN